ncbi:MAG: cation:proton antiporter [Myxococcales bacterium]|nr:cation:proton antiporter [Myxococcales bacterium]
MQADPVASVVLFVALMLVVAKLGGDLAMRIGQPAVLGELVGGMLLGSIGGLGNAIRSDTGVEMLASIGAIVLLFQVGLESRIADMLRVGLSALLVATIGVIGPFFLGLAVGRWLLPGESAYAHAFLGATLCATSVGITARVFADLGRLQTSEARVVLGAAVIDDVLGLLVLAAIAGIATAAERGSAMSVGAIAQSLGIAAAFLVGALAAGVFLSRRLFPLLAGLRARGVLLGAGLSLCFIFSWLAARVGLAPIVGAFAAGLVLEEADYAKFTARGEPGLQKLVEAVADFLVPIFFVLMGARTDLSALVEPRLLGLFAALTVAAVIGKQVCGLAALERGIDRIFVGLAMIPRGEVGLIIASIGLTTTVHGEPMIDRPTFSAVVAMVAATTLMTPPLLKWRVNWSTARRS